MCSKSKRAILCNPHCGPAFGGLFPDFVIKTNSNLNETSFSDLCNSYEHPLYLKRSDEASSFLAGKHKFQTVEIEVFHVF